MVEGFPGGGFCLHAISSLRFSVERILITSSLTPCTTCSMSIDRHKIKGIIFTRPHHLTSYIYVILNARVHVVSMTTPLKQDKINQQLQNHTSLDTWPYKKKLAQKQDYSNPVACKS